EGILADELLRELEKCRLRVVGELADPLVHCLEALHVLRIPEMDREVRIAEHVLRRIEGAKGDARDRARDVPPVTDDGLGRWASRNSTMLRPGKRSKMNGRTMSGGTRRTGMGCRRRALAFWYRRTVTLPSRWTTVNGVRPTAADGSSISHMSPFATRSSACST